MNSTQKQILKLIYIYPKMTRKQIIETMGDVDVTDHTIRTHLARLKAMKMFRVTRHPADYDRLIITDKGKEAIGKHKVNII